MQIQIGIPLGPVLLVAAMITAHAAAASEVELGPRPYYLVNLMKDGPLKDKLLSCADQDFRRSMFSIGHRGAPLMFPEHTAESYRAAARMGAGVLECDVTFTKDMELVCRHSQKDLHTTTNILATPLANKCAVPYTPSMSGGKAVVECRTSDITLAEFKVLKGKIDAANGKGTTVAEYMDGTARWRTDLYAASAGTLLTHTDSVRLFKSLGARFMPELKAPVVQMPYNGFTQQDYAQKLIDEYKAAGIPAADVFVQSFNLDDILYWIENEPEFGKQAIFLDGRYRDKTFDFMKPDTFKPGMADLKAKGINYIAPPMWMLVTFDRGKIVPSPYARAAMEAGLKIVTWTLERSGPLKYGGGWYYQSIKDITDRDGVVYELLHVLAQDVGIKGLFSDWPATVTYYANCMNLKGLP